MESSVENLDPNDAKVEAISIEDAASRVDAYQYIPKPLPKQKYVPVPAPETSFLGNLAFGAYSAAKELEALPSDLGVFGNNIIYGFGDYFGASPQTIERAKLNMDTYSRNSQRIRNDIYGNVSPEIMESWGAKIGTVTSDFVAMLASGGLLSGFAKVFGKKSAKETAQETAKITSFDVGSIGTGTALEITSEQLEGIPLNEDGSIKWEDYSAEQARTEAIGTSSYGVASAFLEKYFGIGLQKKIWTAPVKFTTKGVKGVAAEVGYSVAKTAASEYATEDLQSLANAGIDLIDGSITFAKLPERLQQEFVDNLVTVFPSGMIATGTAITKRAAIKKDLTEMVAPVIKDEAKTKEIVDEIYDGAITNLKDTVSVELELSSELREKHGAIMNSMTQAVEQAVQNSEVIMAMPEEERAQYIAETAKNFADQVLGEANLRGVTIDEVLKASDIQYRDGKLYMKAGEDVKEVDLSFSGMVEALQKKDITFDALARRLNDIGIDDKEYFQVADENARLDEQYPVYEGDAITVNGVERSVYNSNGERINQSAEALTNFYNWFGDSKVVDEQGRPLVVYHGTGQKDLDVFDNVFGRRGIFFTDSKIVADSYAQEKRTAKSGVVPVYLNLSKPFVIDFSGANYVDVPKIDGKSFDDLDDLVYYIKGTKKYDGIIANNIKDAASTASNWDALRAIVTDYIAFDPNQIKSVNNSGAYGETGNIYYQSAFAGARQPKGSFNAQTKAIELLEGADVSTLPHELAHFWLDNMWTYVHSGKASDAYNKRFDAVRDWLGITADQKILKRYQQEKFARGYERYLLEGFSPSPLISDAFDDYGRWLKRVYEDAAKLGKKLSPEVVEFFNSMVAGGVKAPENYVTSETMQKRIAEKVEENEKVTKEVVVEKQKQFDAPAEVTADDVKQGYSRFWEKNKDKVGGVGSIMYDVKENADQIKKATEFVDNNLDAAKKISDGEMEAPEDIVSTFIRLAYIEKMKQIGDMEETRRAMENLSRDATEEGQRIQALSAVSYLQDYYWVNSAIKNRQEYVALKNFANADNPVKKLQEAIDAKINKYIDEFISLDAKGQTELAKKIMDEAGAELGEADVLYQEEIRTPIKEKKTAEQKLRDLIERRVGSNITDEQFQTLLKKHADMINALENTSDEGNPSKLFFKNLSDLENYRNSLAPASTLKVLVSVAGRGSMLTSIKSPLLNIDSNIIEVGLSAIVRRVIYKAQKKSIKNLIDKSEYEKYIKNSWNIYKASGYMISTMSEINPDKLIRGEKITSTAGRTGNALGDLIRKYGQLHEQTVFKYLMGAPDTISKDITFVDTVALEASQIGKTKEKATELFRDACLIEPKTEEGKQIRAVAIEQAMIATYTNNSEISKALLAIRRELNKFGSIGDVISPFVKTPANVQMLGIKYAYGLASPAITFIQKVRNLKKITPDNIKEIAKASFSDNSVTIARNILGVVLSAGIIATLIDDEDYIPDYVLLTPAERELVKEKGLPFNSVGLFGTRINLEYFGGLAMPLTAILNARRQTGVFNTVRGYITGGAAQLLALPVIGDVKEFIANTADIITSQEDMDKIIGRVEDGLIDFISGRAIPAIIPDFAKLIDTYERDTMRNALGRVESKLPIIRENLPPVYEKTTGEPKKREIKAFFFGSRARTGIQNALTDEFTRLQKEGQAVNLSDPTRTGDLSLLSDEQKADIKREFAERYAQKVSDVIESNSYKNKKDEDKKKRINEIRSDIIYKIRREYKHEIREAKELKEADKL